MKYQQGEIVVAKVVSIKPYGAFLKLDDDIVGLLHISEMSFDFVNDVNNILRVGDNIKVKIISVNNADNQVVFSLKVLNEKSVNFRKVIKEKRNSKDLKTRLGASALQEKIKEWINNYKE